MDQQDCVNIFLSEGAGLDTIIAEMKKNISLKNDLRFGKDKGKNVFFVVVLRYVNNRYVKNVKRF